MRFIVVLLLLCPLFGHAAESKSSMKFNQETLEFFHEYIVGYNKYLKDQNNKTAMEEVASHFYIPFMLVPPNSKPGIIGSRSELSNSFTRFVDDQRSKGVQELVWEKIQVKPLTSNKALAINIVNALDANKKLIARRSAVYVLYKSETNDWKIALLNTHEVDKHIKL